MEGLRVLVCGGDGTVKWVLEAIHNLQFEQEPPVSVFKKYSTQF
jgi:hypothetical protein